MGLEQATNVGNTGDLNIVTSLKDVYAIKFGHNAFINKENIILVGLLEKSPDMSEDGIGQTRGGCGKQEIINLTQHEDLVAVRSSIVDVGFMSSILKPKSGEMRILLLWTSQRRPASGWPWRAQSNGMPWERLTRVPLRS
jgi:hypothetical protein